MNFKNTEIAKIEGKTKFTQGRKYESRGKMVF